MKKPTALRRHRLGCLVVLIVCAGALLFTWIFGLVASTINAGTGCVPSVGLPGDPEGIEYLDELTVQTTTGESLSLCGPQLDNARHILATADSLAAGPDASAIALITALQESHLTVYANTAAVPESADIPHERDGNDHDSLGIFQQRPSMGWGTPAELMDPTSSAQAFFGGHNIRGRPPGLLDIEGWETLSPGEAAQLVQVSKYPDAYDAWVPAAHTLLAELSAERDRSGSDRAGV